MKRLTPLLIASVLFGLTTTSGCLIRTRDHHHHHANSARRGPPPPPVRDHRDNGRHRGQDRCRWERC